MAVSDTGLKIVFVVVCDIEATAATLEVALASPVASVTFPIAATALTLVVVLNVLLTLIAIPATASI